MVSVKRQEDLKEIEKIYPDLKHEACHAHTDGECFWSKCPQTRDNGRNRKSHCPLPHWTDDSEW